MTTPPLVAPLTEHGTYAAYQRHNKAGEKPCPPCRKAAADYARERRRDAEVRERERLQDVARKRAWSRLADMHPVKYRALYAEELLAVMPDPDDARAKRPTGTCHTCGRAVTGERRLCGACAARRDRNRKRRYA